MAGEAKRILIVTHKKPDGDAIGSSLALRLVLKHLGQEATVAIVDGAPESYSYLPQFFKIADGFRPQDFDMAVIIDCGGWKRTGFFEDDELNIDWPNHLAVVDHHAVQKLTPGLHIVDPQMCSSAQLIFYVAEEWGAPLTQELATCLMTGLSTDTGSFKHSNTTAEVFRIAARLMEAGASLNKITQNIYLGRSVPALRLWGRTLNKIKEDRELGMIFSVITKKDLDECGANLEDLEGVIDLMNSVPGTSATMLLSERGGEVKGSLRTNRDDVDVSKLAAIFGGGGHIQAAGFSVKKD